MRNLIETKTIDEQWEVILSILDDMDMTEGQWGAMMDSYTDDQPFLIHLIEFFHLSDEFVFKVNDANIDAACEAFEASEGDLSNWIDSLPSPY